MKVKSKKDALYHCYDLWLWLALNPIKTKDDWPGWKTNGGHLNYCSSDCPCCEYTWVSKRSYEIENACDLCPIQNWTPGKAKRDDCPCCRKESPFAKWDNYNDSKGDPEHLRRKTKYALEIANLALDALAKEEE